MIQIAAYRGISLISRAIRWQTRSEVSHIGMLFTCDLVVTVNGEMTVIREGNVTEAWHKGGVLLNESLSTKHTPGTRVDLFDFVDPLTVEEGRGMAAFLVAQLGKGYDWRSALRFVTRQPQSQWDRDKWFCSELATAACIVGKRELFRNTEPWRVPPDWCPRSLALKYSRTEVTR